MMISMRAIIFFLSRFILLLVLCSCEITLKGQPGLIKKPLDQSDEELLPIPKSNNTETDGEIPLVTGDQGTLGIIGVFDVEDRELRENACNETNIGSSFTTIVLEKDQNTEESIYYGKNNCVDSFGDNPLTELNKSSVFAYEDFLNTLLLGDKLTVKPQRVNFVYTIAYQVGVFHHLYINQTNPDMIPLRNRRAIAQCVQETGTPSATSWGKTYTFYVQDGPILYAYIYELIDGELNYRIEQSINWFINKTRGTQAVTFFPNESSNVKTFTFDELTKTHTYVDEFNEDPAIVCAFTNKISDIAKRGMR